MVDVDTCTSLAYNQSRIVGELILICQTEKYNRLHIVFQYGVCTLIGEISLQNCPYNFNSTPVYMYFNIYNATVPCNNLYIF